MYLYFDEYGTLKEIINDVPLRAGNSNVNEVYVYVENSTYGTGYHALATYKLASGGGYPVVQSEEPLTRMLKIPYDRKRDLKFFNYNKAYPFIKFVIPDDVLAIPDGVINPSISISITIVGGGQALGLTRVSLALERREIIGGTFVNEVAPDKAISVGMWNELLKLIASIKGNVVSISYVPTNLTNYTVGTVFIVTSNNKIYKVVQGETEKELVEIDLCGEYRQEIDELYASFSTTTQGESVTTLREVLNAFSGFLKAKTLAEVVEDLQSQIEAIKDNPDVVDVVSTYAELQEYDTSTLGDNDIIRVLVDETHNNASSFYRWNKSTLQWAFIGTTGEYYSKEEINGFLEEKIDKSNATSNADENTVVKRDATGHASIASPITDYNISNKKYVDETVNAKWLVIIADETQVGGTDGAYCPDLTATQISQIYTAYTQGKTVRVQTTTDTRRYYDVLMCSDFSCTLLAQRGYIIEYFSFAGEVSIETHSTIVNKDLNAQGLYTGNSYYRHIGTTSTNFKHGVIYFYSNGSFKAIDGSGGGSGTKVTVNGVEQETWDADTKADISYVDSMFYKVYTTTVMNTSTLPSIQVPQLTAEQIGNIQTAISQGKEVTIDASYGGITNQFKVLESDHDGDVGGIRLTYYNNYLDYTIDGNTVVVTYTAIGEVGKTERLTGSSGIFSLSLQPDVFYIIDTAITNFTPVIMSYGKGNPLWEVKFKTSTSFTGQFPTTIKWVNGTPTFKANTEYTLYFENSRESGKYDGYVVEM